MMKKKNLYRFRPCLLKSFAVNFMGFIAKKLSPPTEPVRETCEIQKLLPAVLISIEIPLFAV